MAEYFLGHLMNNSVEIFKYEPKNLVLHAMWKLIEMKQYGLEISTNIWLNHLGRVYILIV